VWKHLKSSYLAYDYCLLIFGTHLHIKCNDNMKCTCLLWHHKYIADHAMRSQSLVSSVSIRLIQAFHWFASMRINRDCVHNHYSTAHRLCSQFTSFSIRFRQIFSSVVIYWFGFKSLEILSKFAIHSYFSFRNES